MPHAEPGALPAHIDSIPGAPFTAPVPGRVMGRRSEALAGLSRDHHQALARAITLKRANEETAEAAWQEFHGFWREDGADHFIEEETVLLPAYAEFADPDHPAIIRMLLEHVLIRARVSELEARAEHDAADLNLLGQWFELHVRLEERVLFPLIEAALPERAQAALLKRLGSEGG
ncbi:MAG: hemerythrin domain-containing protein [Solirubrobacterales bacterium]